MADNAPSIQLELRVLTGLHQGAALLLIDEETVLGCAPGCDVVLLDDGIAPRHLRILMCDGGWAWHSGGDSEVFAPDTRLAGASVLLGRGHRLRIANVWLMLAGVDDPWPMPAELLAWQRLPSDAVALKDAELALQVAAARRRKTHSFVLVGLCLGLVGLLLLANAILLPGAKAEPAADGAQAPAGAGRASTTRSGPTLAVAPVSAPPVLAAAQLRSATSALLADHRLEQAVQVTAEPGQLTLHATLGPRARARFEQSLLALQRRFGANTRIEATVTSAESTLPFRIHQVLMGGDSHVVLADGRAMYEGDRIGGYRLVSIREGEIVFAGPRRVEVPW